jgi:ribose transport system permease protein
MTTTQAPTPAASRFHTADAAWRRALSGSWVPVTAITLLLFVISPAVAPRSINTAALLSMIPFAAVLAIAAAGQTLVVQQRGLDLSLPGGMALGAVLSTGLAQILQWPWALALAAGLIVPGLFGLINGILVTYFRVMSLVVTLGMNSVLLGIVLAFSNGTPPSASPALNGLAFDRLLGVPNTLIIAVVIVVVAGLLTRESVIGHRLTAVGISERAARTIGIRVNLHQILAYAFAGVCYGTAGALLAGYTQTPELFLGDDYLLPSVAAVVLGGTALTGGLASVISSGIAALFLTQLQQLLQSLGWATSLQYIIEAAVLIAVVLLREFAPMGLGMLRRRREAQAVTTPDVVTTP